MAPAPFSTAVLFIEVDVRLVGHGHGRYNACDRPGEDGAVRHSGAARLFPGRAHGVDGHHAGGYLRHVRAGALGANRLRAGSRARRHAAARPGIDGRAVQRSRHGGRRASGARGCALSPGHHQSGFAGFGVRRSHVRPVRAARRSRGGHDYLRAPPRRFRGAAIDEVRRTRRPNCPLSIRSRNFDSSTSTLQVCRSPWQRFADGPWVPDAMAADRFDADLQAIRRVRAIVRVRPVRTFVGFPLDDLEVGIDVSPRNLNLE